MREMLDSKFEKLMIMHNRDYDKVMNIYHEMYNIDYLDDIIKGVRQPSDHVHGSGVFCNRTFQTNLGRSSPPRNIDQELPGRFPRPSATHSLFNEGNSYKGKRYPLEAIENLCVANANRSMLHFAAYDPRSWSELIDIWEADVVRA